MKDICLVLLLTAFLAAPAWGAEDIVDLEPEKFFEVHEKSAADLPAEQRFQAYKEKHQNLNRDYAGKTVRWAGVITRISEGPRGEPFVDFSPALGVMLRCYFPQSAVEELVKLKRGQNLTVICTYKDTNVLTELTNCVIEDNT